MVTHGFSPAGWHLWHKPPHGARQLEVFHSTLERREAVRQRRSFGLLLLGIQDRLSWFKAMDPDLPCFRCMVTANPDHFAARLLVAMLDGDDLSLTHAVNAVQPGAHGAGVEGARMLQRGVVVAVHAPHFHAEIDFMPKFAPPVHKHLATVRRVS